MIQCYGASLCGHSMYVLSLLSPVACLLSSSAALDAMSPRCPGLYTQILYKDARDEEAEKQTE